jgi:urease accessory protein
LIPWLLLQLADSGFPAGGFAHSAGLEAGVQLGRVTDRRELQAFLDAALWQVGHGTLPLVGAAHDARDAAALAALDALTHATLSSHIARAASRTQGKAFIATCARVFDAPPVAEIHAAVLAGSLRGHHAPVFGAALRALGVERDATQRLALYLALRALTSAAIRLGLIGPHEAQRVQHDLAPRLDEVLEACGGLPVHAVTQTTPVNELLGAMHDTLYSRLFQS